MQLLAKLTPVMQIRLDELQAKENRTPREARELEVIVYHLQQINVINGKFLVDMEVIRVAYQ
jgi:hypothetical protein